VPKTRTNLGEINEWLRKTGEDGFMQPARGDPKSFSDSHSIIIKVSNKISYAEQ
jgi:hypothetical protein